jgi:hypothetical protein
VREKINSDPRFQVGIIVVLIAAAAFMFLKPGGGEEGEEAAPTEATVSIAGTEASGTATGATPGEAVEGAVEGAVEAASAEAAAIPTSIPAPPMPAPVASAYDSGQTVVLLVVHDGGIDDKLVKRAAQQLRTRPGVAFFVVPAKQISRYAAITLGADVQQVPALLVMKPRDVSEGVPQASVDYGFQTGQSVVQAVIDAGYDGPEATYHPN